MNLFLRISILVITATALLFFWDNPLLKPLKIFVVLLHELSHALGALLTGGKVTAIAIQWDESGFMQASGGWFPVTAMAGYLGSMAWGSLMLYSALKNRFVRTVSIFIGALVLFFSFYPDEKIMSIDQRLPKYLFGALWGLLLVLTAVFFKRVNHFILFIMGGLTSLYAVYDLDDFFSGHIMDTDAGKLATKYFSGEITAKVVAYFIAALISALAIYIFVKILSSALREPEMEAEEGQATDAENSEPITPEMLEWLNKQKK